MAEMKPTVLFVAVLLLCASGASARLFGTSSSRQVGSEVRPRDAPRLPLLHPVTLHLSSIAFLD